MYSISLLLTAFWAMANSLSVNATWWLVLHSSSAAHLTAVCLEFQQLPLHVLELLLIIFSSLDASVASNPFNLVLPNIWPPFLQHLYRGQRAFSGLFHFVSWEPIRFTNPFFPLVAWWPSAWCFLDSDSYCCCCQVTLTPKATREDLYWDTIVSPTTPLIYISLSLLS